MATDEESDPLISVSRQSSSIQSLMFPRRKTQVLLPLEPPGFRRNSRRCSYSLHPEYLRNRSLVLLERQNMPAHSWESYRKSADELKAIKNRKVREFYENQNCLIDDLTYVDSILESSVPYRILHSFRRRPSAFMLPPSRRVSFNEESSLLPDDEPREDLSRIVSIAIFVNFMANVFLLVAKIIVTLTSSSLSVLASLVDSALDFMSTLIIYIVSRIIQHRDWRTRHKFPVGKARLEPIGVLVFSVIMIVSFIQVMVQAFQRLLEEEETHAIVVLSLQSILIMISTVVVKFGCWLWSRSVKNSGVQALAQDAMNDVVFNSFSLVFPLVGQFAKIWWLDPVGAIFISLYIVVEWINTAQSHIQHLTGTSATVAQLQPIIYMASRFSDRIRKVMHVDAYHAGDNILVEVSILLDEKMPLRDVHDLGEALQYSIESMEGIERAFVHCDYAVGNPSGHIRRGG